MRLFAALRPPEALARAVVGAFERARSDRPQLRWIGPEQLHLTLAFYGETHTASADGLRERLARLAGRTSPLHLSIGGVGHFGAPRRHQVLWVGVEDLDAGGRVGPLRRLAEGCAAAGHREGLEVPPRWRAHLSIARAGPGVESVRTLAEVELPGLEWTAGNLLLIRSQLGGGPAGRPRYEPEGDWLLAGRSGEDQRIRPTRAVTGEDGDLAG